MKNEKILLCFILIGLSINGFTQKKNNFENKKEVVKQLKFKDLNLPIDTLVYKTKDEFIQITPLGLFTNSSNFKYQFNLEKDLMIECATIYETKNYFYAFYVESDLMEGVGILEKINKLNAKNEYKKYIRWFGYPNPLIKNGYAYIASWGTVGKLDLESGESIWIKENLYDSEKSAFSGFESIIPKKNSIKFISKNGKTKKLNFIIIEDNTGKVLEIMK